MTDTADIATADDKAAICKLAYDESVRVLGDQARTLEQLRVRMAAVLATATTATAFIVGIVAKADRDDQDFLYWLGCVVGTLLYAVVIGLTVRVLRPKYEWRFNMSPSVIVDDYAVGDPPATLVETHEMLARFNERNVTHNQVNLYAMQKWLSWALTLFIVEIACWSCLLAKVG